MAIKEIIDEYETRIAEHAINAGITPEQQELYATQKTSAEEAFDNLIATRALIDKSRRRQKTYQAIHLGSYCIAQRVQLLVVQPAVREARHNMTVPDRIVRVLRLYIPGQSVVDDELPLLTDKNSVVVGERSLDSSSHKAGAVSMRRLGGFRDLLDEVIARTHEQ